MNCDPIFTLSKPNYRFFALLVGIITITGLLAAGAIGYRLNFTPSMPLGLWRIVATADYPRGATVAVCPPVDASFLPRGSCPLGMQPLLKQVVGLPGDVVTVTPAGASINHSPLLPHSAPLSQTSAGQPLPQRLGTWRLTGYWLYGTEHDRSFDSRYFGDVPVSNLKGVAQWVW